MTDLTKVYFEPLVGIRLLARQREVEEQHGESQRRKDGGGSSLDMGGEEAVTGVLEDLDGLMSGGLEDAELSVTSGDLYVSGPYSSSVPRARATGGPHCSACP